MKSLNNWIAKRKSIKARNKYEDGFSWAMKSYFLYNMRIEEIQSHVLCPMDPNEFDAGARFALLTIKILKDNTNAESRIQRKNLSNRS